jgi:CRISPR-associated protein Cas1
MTSGGIMAVVYITKPGVKIHLEGKHLLAVGENFRQTIYTFNLERLVLVGKVEITHAALSHLFRNETSVIYLSRQGGFLGSITGVEPKNVYLRLKQYERNNENNFRLTSARYFVQGKIKNMRSMLMRLGRTLQNKNFTRATKELKLSLESVQAAKDLQALRGVEGHSTRTYFQAMRWGFPEELCFHKRVRRPPTDPVNACLSFGYTVLMNIVHGAVCTARLDPALGCLHEVSYGRNSLSLDLMEEFRTPIVDMTVLSCFNLGILKKEDFLYQEPKKNLSAFASSQEWLEKVDVLANEQEAEPKPGDSAIDGDSDEPNQTTAVYLGPDAKKRFLKRLEKRFSTTMHYVPAGKSITLRHVIQRQAEQYAHWVRGERDGSTPITPR